MHSPMVRSGDQRDTYADDYSDLTLIRRRSPTRS